MLAHAPNADTAALAGWCPEADTRDSVVARRNVLLALWAGRLMALPETELGAYAAAVHRADFAAPGDADVVEKVARDLKGAGVPAALETVRAALSACHREALRQTATTD